VLETWLQKCRDGYCIAVEKKAFLLML